jgi:hypothetical protein
MFSNCSNMPSYATQPFLEIEVTVQGQRIPGGFLLITGIDGTRYAVRQHAVAVIHDADECHDETIVQLYGGHVVRVPYSLDEVVAWFT